ncbi:hypothetical protein FoTM2_000743 [Fusarium oxysporum f. sp. vasinfectum]|nr:hypothetical protein FoTM2_000743 [Fusarium oxysporum f. sp. vasinfectum]
MSSMITAAQWVPRGFAAPFPQKYTLDEAEFERIAELAKLQLDDAQEDLEEAEAAQKGAKANETEDNEEDSEMKIDEDKPTEKTEINLNDDDLKEYDLENYDNDDGEDEPGNGEGMGMFGNIKSLAYYESNKDDPYITIDADKEQEDEDREELQILATDNLIVAAKVEDEMAHLEVFVYEDEADNLYVHHDIMLPAIPLCVEWIDMPVNKPGAEKDSTGNFVAVGTMDPDIEMRSLPRWGVESDVENVRWDPHDPNFFFVSTENGVIHYHDVRNAPSDPTGTKAVWTLQAHDESVSSFDINPVVPGYMVTGSTDKTVKLWNIQPTGPSVVVSRNLDVGKVFSTTFAPDPEVAFRLAVAGSKGTMHVWDTSTNASVRKAFAQRVPEQRGKGEDRLVGVNNDDSSDDDDEEDDKQDDDDSMDED